MYGFDDKLAPDTTPEDVAAEMSALAERQQVLQQTMTSAQMEDRAIQLRAAALNGWLAHSGMEIDPGGEIVPFEQTG